MNQLTSIGLAAAVGAIVSFVLASFPQISQAWSKVKYKREIMASVFILAPFLVLGLSCGNFYLTRYGCTEGAFVTPQFYVENIVLGFSAFAGSQWSFVHGAEKMSA